MITVGKKIVKKLMLREIVVSKYATGGENIFKEVPSFNERPDLAAWGGDYNEIKIKFKDFKIDVGKRRKGVGIGEGLRTRKIVARVRGV